MTNDRGTLQSGTRSQDHDRVARGLRVGRMRTFYEVVERTTTARALTASFRASLGARSASPQASTPIIYLDGADGSVLQDTKW